MFHHELTVHIAINQISFKWQYKDNRDNRQSQNN